MPSIAAGFTSDGRDHGVRPALDRLRHRHVDERELEQRADAGQVVEARAGDLRGALDVDRAEERAELDVVARLEVGGEVARRADRLEQDEVVLAALGDAVLDDVVDLEQQPRGLARGGRRGRPRPS